jgi:hypothetical protein
MRTQRAERLGRELEEMEAEFRARLLAALTRCADGNWGLFGQNDHIPGSERRNSGSGAPELLALGAEIAELREKLGLPPFELHARLLAFRGQSGANTPGEPKLARAWLKELNLGSAS